MFDVDRFFKAYGTPERPEKASNEVLTKYSGRVPSEIIEFWQRFGFAQYANGLLWIVNPSQLEDVLCELIGEAGAVPIIRTAFGKIVYWHKDQFTLLDVHVHGLVDAGDSAFVIFNFFLVMPDARSAILQESMFKRALKKFGALQADEIYGFKLPLAMGGKPSISNMAKMKMREQLSILAQLG